MESIRKKVLNELFLAPSVVFPIVAGASAWLVSWGIGGNTSMNLAGLVGVLGGLGWMATRIIFQLDEITERTRRFAEEAESREENRRLDNLYDRLMSRSDRRVAELWMSLRTARDRFEQLARSPDNQVRVLSISTQFRSLFWAAIQQLENSDKLTDSVFRLPERERRSALQRLESMIAEIRETAGRLNEAVLQFEQLAMEQPDDNLDQLGKELEQSLDMARRAEERVRELEINATYERPLKE
jgi:uncharacterized protein YukE